MVDLETGRHGKLKYFPQNEIDDFRIFHRVRY